MDGFYRCLSKPCFRRKPWSLGHHDTTTLLIMSQYARNGEQLSNTRTCLRCPEGKLCTTCTARVSQLKKAATVAFIK